MRFNTQRNYQEPQRPYTSKLIKRPVRSQNTYAFRGEPDPRSVPGRSLPGGGPG